MTVLDSWRDPGREVRITVYFWIAEEAITDQYIVQPRTLRMVWEYLKRVGPVAVWRKFRSRIAEGNRNQKAAGVGVGRILEAPLDCETKVGQQVIFFAPNHSLNWPRITLDKRLAIPLGAEEVSEKDGTERPRLPEMLRRHVGWSHYSGWPLEAGPIREELSKLKKHASATRLEHFKEASDETEFRERKINRLKPPHKPTAVIFGFGNYAKTQIIPHIRSNLQLAAVHEIDPDQLANASGLGASLDTCPWPRKDEKYDAWFIAGFHHTHAPLAVHALRYEAYAVVEKPLATTKVQHQEIEKALHEVSRSRLFTCFHKRYSHMNEWLKKDLQSVQSGDPVDMHCIVYEIPLPSHHWYNWPASGSRLISNGCHWLDYFLYVNDFVKVIDAEVIPLRGSDLSVWVRLDNCAQMVMSLTDAGSQRLGVRDIIELRTKGATAQLIDGFFYQAENRSRVLRRRKVNPMKCYQRMYSTICKRILLGEEGDSFESLRSTGLMLDLESELKRKRGSN